MPYFNTLMDAFEAVPYEKIESLIETNIEQARKELHIHSEFIEPRMRTIGTNTSRYKLTPKQREELYTEWRKFFDLVKRVM